MKCNHNPNEKGATLIRFPRRNMVCPEISDWICSVCKKAFRFERTVDGQFKKISHKKPKKET